MTTSDGEVHVGVREAKTQLSRLIDRVLAGQDIVIDRRGEPVARLIRVDAVAHRSSGRTGGPS
jgi:prevent-host-death family protein